MDLLVKLYDLPAPEQPAGISIRRAFAAEKQLAADFVAANFSRGWASECEVGFGHLPVGCFIATCAETICGFACFDATARGFFGPTGVAEQWRGRGIGAALLLHTLHDMRARGYAYAVIGAAGDTSLYRRIGAIEIPDSNPGFYRDLLREK
jgi:predicted N-acetyltransferase YhbS